MLSKGGLFQFYAGIEQLLWNLVLSLLLCGAFFSLSKKELVLALIIIGLNSYLLIFENKAKSSSLLDESRAPVGSSARISLGFVIRALATAHLCF